MQFDSFIFQYHAILENEWSGMFSWCQVLLRVCRRYNIGWLTHFPLVPHIYVSESGEYWFRKWLVAYSAPGHYLNQCWVILNWTLENKLQWNCNKDTKLFVHENVYENYRLRNGGHLVQGWWVNTRNIATFCEISLIVSIDVIWSIKCTHKRMHVWYQIAHKFIGLFP